MAEPGAAVVFYQIEGPYHAITIILIDHSGSFLVWTINGVGDINQASSYDFNLR
jgi:hypothetical protein